MLACTMTKYEFIILAKNINGYTWNIVLVLLAWSQGMKIIKRWCKTLSNLHTVLLTEKVLFLWRLMYLRNLSSKVINSWKIFNAKTHCRYFFIKCTESIFSKKNNLNNILNISPKWMFLTIFKCFKNNTNNFVKLQYFTTARW